jgi:hypothetical protein
MIKVDLSGPVENLDGSVADFCYDKLVANLLWGKTMPGISDIKLASWALELHKTGKLSIDKVDCESLEKALRHRPT